MLYQLHAFFVCVFFLSFPILQNNFEAHMPVNNGTAMFRHIQADG